MRKLIAYYFYTFIFISHLSSHQVFADAAEALDITPLPSHPATPSPTSTPLPPIPEPSEPVPMPSPEIPKIEKPRTISAFTGKITRNKVRMRAQPSLEGPILRELSTGEMVVVTGETEDFYAIQPPTDVKGYIFRTFVLDGVVEGNHVNVRSEPDLAASVIAQMNSGDRINGSVSSRDKKWIEMNLPESVRFYISKDYVEKIGDAGYISRYNKRLLEISNIVMHATQASQQELQKPFSQVNIDPIIKDLQKAIANYSDFPSETTKAKDLLATIQTAYLSKKVTHMENTVQTMAQASQSTAQPIDKAPVSAASTKMTAWLPVEHALYSEWSAQNSNANMEEFYQHQAENAVELKGLLEAYDKPIKNKPGDFIVVNPSTHLPIAYVYSTQVDLQNKIGQEVTLKAAARDNHHFAYPAYFILSIN